MLLAWLDGAAPKDVDDHLLACAYCRARAGVLAGIEGNLMSALFRVDCPTTELLGEFQLGLLDRLERDPIAEHLKTCPYCTNELEMLEGYLVLVGSEIEPRKSDGIRTIIARLLPLNGFSSNQIQALTPATLGVRGSHKPQAIYEAQGTQLAMSISSNPEHRGFMDIFGIITGQSEKYSDVYIKSGEHIISKGVVDATGQFTLEGIPTGTYSLMLESADLRIQVDDLEV